MCRCKTLLFAGSILMLIGAAAPAAIEAKASAKPHVRSRTAAQADTPTIAAQADPASPLNQPIAVDLVDAPLGSALETIARRAGVTLAYNPDILPPARTVTLHATALPALDAFARLLDGTGLEPSMTRGGHLTLARVPKPPATSAEATTNPPQQGAVTGRVTDAGTGETLRGAQVRVEESELSAVTDAEGRYTLDGVPPGTHTLTASIIGYGVGRQQVTVTAGTTATLDFALTVSAVPLDEMIVTGTMVPTQMRAVPSPISVVTSADIEGRGIARFEDIVRSIPGVGVVSSGGDDPRLSFLHVRGATSLTESQSTVKTYIDGVEISNPVYALNQIDPANIERIEVVRGPQASTLHGPEALAGVVQIFTKKGHIGNQRPRVHATVSGGSLESQYKNGLTPVQHHHITMSGGERNMSFNVAASYRHTGEWVEDELLEQLAWDVDNSVGKDIDLSLGLRYALGRVNAEVSARFHTNAAGLPLPRAVVDPSRDGRWRYPYASRPLGLESELDAQTYGIRINYEATPSWRHHFAIGHDGTIIDYRQPRPRGTTPADTFLYYQQLDWRRRSLTYSTAVEASLGQLSSTLQAGLDRSSFSQHNVITRDALQLTGGLGNETADVALGEVVNHGFFAQAQLGWRNRLFLIAGLRADGSTGFGDDLGYAWSPRMGLTHVFELQSITIKSRASYGAAIRPPEPSRKLGRTSANVVTLANEQLAPEKQSGYDLGVDVYWGSHLSVSVTRYDQEAQDLVAVAHLTDFSATPRVQQYQNVGRIRNTGWELEGTAKVADLTLKGHYSLLDSEVRQLAPTYTGSDFVVGQRPLWTPRNTAGVSITWAHPRGTVGVGMTHKGAWQAYRFLRYFNAVVGTDPDREPFTGNLRDYVDLYSPTRRYELNASYRITRNVTALLMTDNLFNDRTPDRTDLDLVRGRQVVVGVRAEFDL